MSRSMKWLLAVAAAALVAISGFGAGALLAQDGGKVVAKDGGAERGAKVDGAKAKGADEAKAERARVRAERLAKFKKDFPAAKVSLAAAVKSVEEANPGARAYSVSYGLSKSGELTLEVGLLVGSAFASAKVDPKTGAPSTVRQGDDDDDDDDGDDDDDDDDDDEDEDEDD